MSEAEEAELRAQLQTVTAERNKYHTDLTDLRLKTLESNFDDHEKRLRDVEVIGTRFNTVYALFGANVLVAILLKFAVP